MSTLRTLRMRGNRQSTIEIERVVDECETVAVGLATSGTTKIFFLLDCIVKKFFYFLWFLWFLWFKFDRVN